MLVVSCIIKNIYRPPSIFFKEIYVYFVLNIDVFTRSQYVAFTQLKIRFDQIYT